MADLFCDEMELDLAQSWEMVECGICADDVPTRNSFRIVPTEDRVCGSCFEDGVKQLFKDALMYEHAYPVKWGSTTVNPHDFAQYMEPGFIMKWIFRLREYERPRNEKVYCSHLVLSDDNSPVALKEVEILSAVDDEKSMHECGSFLGGTLPITSAISTYACVTCQGSTCGICSSSFFDNPLQHVCIDAEDTLVVADDPFKDMKRGEEIQICPTCEAPTQLKDGCNYITCKCRSCFCYCCAETLPPKEEQTDHFLVGKPCPKWNKKGASNARHEPNPVVLAFRSASHRLDSQTKGLILVYDELQPQALEKALSDPDQASRLAWAGLGRLTAELRYTLQSHFIIDLLPKQSRHFQQVRDAYLRSYHEINVLVTEIKRITTVEHQAMEMAIATGQALVHERHEALVKCLDESIATLTTEEEAQARRQTYLTELRRRFRLDPEINLAIRNTTRVMSEARAKETQDSANAEVWSAIVRLVDALNAALQVPVQIEIPPMTLATLKSLRTTYSTKGEIVQKQLAAVASQGIVQLDKGLVAALSVYQTKHEVFSKELDRRINDMVAQDIIDSVYKRDSRTIQLVEDVLQLRDDALADVGPHPANTHMHRHISALSTKVTEGLKLQHATEHLASLPVETLVSYRFSYLDQHVSLSETVKAIATQAYVKPDAPPSRSFNREKWAMALAAYHARHHPFMARIDHVILLGRVREVLDATIPAWRKLSTEPLQAIGSHKFKAEAYWGLDGQTQQPTVTAMWCNVADVSTQLLRLLQMQLFDSSSQPLKSLVLFRALYQQLHYLMESLISRLNLGPSSRHLDVSVRTALIHAYSAARQHHDSFVDRLDSGITTGKPDGILPKWPVKQFSLGHSEAAHSFDVQQSTRSLQVPIPFRKPLLDGLSWTVDTKETKNLLAALAEANKNAEAAAKLRPKTATTMRLSQDLARLLSGALEFQHRLTEDDRFRPQEQTLLRCQIMHVNINRKAVEFIASARPRHGPELGKMLKGVFREYQARHKIFMQRLEDINAERKRELSASEQAIWKHRG
ncbi:hypothetical protein LTR97_005472 [Elasticomyces elasticus]|uniref:RING-type domain-containing protein n=1 Tax=Elasticomyces elasticus TaxID=574655 RepID=A0AAN7VSD2_9PEZI|nr:hypothetical protein LTR97_005472 [Elasticomyces elasticus]